MQDPIDTSGWRHVSLKPWHQDRRYTEVWVSNDGWSWRMLGMERPRPTAQSSGSHKGASG